MYLHIQTSTDWIQVRNVQHMILLLPSLIMAVLEVNVLIQFFFVNFLSTLSFHFSDYQPPYHVTTNNVVFSILLLPVIINDSVLFLLAGHYVSFAKNYINGKWYEFNDSWVSEGNL